MNPKQIAERVAQARERISAHYKATPIVQSNIQEHLYLKLENKNPTGSFKVRGSLNKILRLKEANVKINVYAASTGNHGMGVANALKLTGDEGTIFLPENASQAKVEKLKSYAINLKFYGKDSLKTEIHAKEQAHLNNGHWVSPYNDLDIIAGQGTIALEILEQIQVDKIYVTVGGGGLISGIASVLKTLKPEIEIIGCQPKNSPEMYLSIAKGEIITEDNFPSTISDGSAGGLEIDAITFPLCQQLIDRFILIPEKQIEEAIKLAWDNDQERIEGAAGVALAAAMNDTEAKQDCKKLAIICGGNIDESLFQKIIQ